MGRKPTKPKEVRYERIPSDDDPEGVHPLIRELVAAHHPDVAEATFGAAWQTGVKKNPDGLVLLGKCVKGSDLHREFQGEDFVIVLNAEAWRRLSPDQRRALVDHELTHAAVAKDKTGDIKRDDRGRPVFRVRKHDLEEFRSIVQRYGCYLSDIEQFVTDAMNSPKPPGATLLDIAVADQDEAA